MHADFRNEIKMMKSLKVLIWKSWPVLLIRKTANTFGWSAAWLTLKRQIQDQRAKDAEIWRQGIYYKPAFYKDLDENGQLFLQTVKQNCAPQEKILDICCNQGRFLMELCKGGYSNLHGFDIMSGAIELCKNHQNFDPKKISVETSLAQNYFPRQKDASFDWAMTYSATIELIHPEFDIFKELGRVVRKGLVLFINENGHYYPRFYKYLIKKTGFKKLKRTPSLIKEISSIVALK